MSAVEKYRSLGFNCAEAIVMACNEVYGTDLPVRAATAFGGGLSCGEVCGACAGGVMAIGMLFGRDDGFHRNDAGNPARLFMKRMKEKYGCVECRELKRRGTACEELVDYAYDALVKCVKETKAEVK